MTSTKRKLDYYHEKVNLQVVSWVVERLVAFDLKLQIRKLENFKKTNSTNS